MGGEGTTCAKKYAVLTVRTTRRNDFVDITALVEGALQEQGLQSGALLVYCPHTTAGITINEGADPDVQSDILRFLGQAVPDDMAFDHAEGNSDSHVKTSWVGSSELVIVEDNRLALGRWQRIFLCEFDGPRSRRVWVKSLVG
jgi:secondary thiamine-phosphate synthase enzyme